MDGCSAAIYLGLMYKGYQKDPQTSPLPPASRAQSNVLEWKEAKNEHEKQST
jgi:hypothetical protein